MSTTYLSNLESIDLWRNILSCINRFNVSGSRGPIVAFLGFHRKYFFRHLGRDKLAQASINTSKLSCPDKKLHQREQKAYMESL